MVPKDLLNTVLLEVLDPLIEDIVDCRELFVHGGILELLLQAKNAFNLLHV